MNSIDQYIDPHNSECEQFEMQISEMLDGELSNDEMESVNEHISVCDSCRELRDGFASVNRSVSLLGASSAVAENEQYSETFVVIRQKPSLKNWFSVLRLVPMAAVAALAIGLFLVMSQPAPEAAAEQLTPEQFVKPMTDLNRINQQQQRDQELMLRTLGMDLRSLKLELNQLENAGPEDRTRFENQIEEMLNRVEQFEGR